MNGGPNERANGGSNERPNEGEAEPTPAEAFKIIGNETRLTILQELLRSTDRPVSFSELRKRVGMRDGSQFNYHLRKLEAGFVQKTDEGYHIRPKGIDVVRAIVAGTFTEHSRVDPFDIGSPCHLCGESLEARYEREIVYVECSDCGKNHDIGLFSSGALVGRTADEWLVAYDQWARRGHALALAGVCEFCGGSMTRTLLDGPSELPAKVRYVELAESLDDLDGPAAVYECDNCYLWHYLSVGAHLLFDPDVVGFYRDHGIDLNEVPRWELDWCVTNRPTTVVSDEPRRYEVSIPLDDEVLRATLDEALSVVDVVREAGTAGVEAGG